MSFESWPVVMKLLFIATPFFVSLVGVSISFYITISRDYDRVCSAIKSNPYLEQVKAAWGTSSLKWRWMLVCNVGGLVTFPGLALRYGKLDAEELKAFPSGLKQKLVISVWLSIIGFAWIAIAVAVVEFSKV
jgi:hypothetical protein